MAKWLVAIGAALVLGAPALSHEVVHAGHDHQHAKGCGHTSVVHQGHSDYLHDGHLHGTHGAHVDEHVLEVSKLNPAVERRVSGAHSHSATDGHPTVQHGSHFDCIHDGRLHHAHGGHVDDHGAVRTTS
jgi:hypothetical protein